MTNTETALHECPEPGCLIFAYDRAEDRDEHVAAGAHVYEADLHARTSTLDLVADAPSLDAPERHAGASRGPAAPRFTVTPYSWTKVDGAWCVRVPAGQHAEGDTVTVTKKDGTTAEVTLGSVKLLENEGGMDVFAPAPREQAGPVGYRWVKVGQDWLVAGPPAPVGSTITVTKKDGTTAEAVVETCDTTGATPERPAVHHVRRAAERAPETSALPDVPAGHYAVPSDGDNDLVFLRVDRPTEGRWAGRTFVKMIVGGHPEMAVKGPQAATLLQRVADAGPEAAGALYGQQIGRCCRCNRTLTDEASRAAGIGPDCATRAW